MTTTSKVYGNYVVFVESKALRGRSKQEYLRHVRKPGMRQPGRSLFEIRRRQPLPMVLTRDEVHQLLGAVRENRFKAGLALIYHCGLRVGEAVRLRPKDIEGKRGMLRVIDGKGGRNREVPVAQQMIQRLRSYWCSHRNAHWLFPGVGRGWKERSPTLQVAMAAVTEPTGRSPATGCKEAATGQRAAACTLPESGTFRVQ
jgi:integrase